MTEKESGGNRDIRITPSKVGTCRVLTLSGRMTTEACELFRAAAVTEIQAGARSLVVDISGLDTMSSCGIGTLVWIDDDCKKSKCRMHLVNTNPHIQRVLALTGLDRQFHVAKDVRQAASGGKD